MTNLTDTYFRFRAHAGIGGYLNVYGNEQVSKNRDVCIWSLSTANAQKWIIKDAGDTLVLQTALNDAYALNYHWKNGRGKSGNCDILPFANNKEDSAILFISIDSHEKLFQIKLANYDLYLSAHGNKNGDKVRWEPCTGKSDQLWKAEAVPLDRFIYPTQGKKLSQVFHAAHKGIDIPATVGTPVYAFFDGVVAFTQSSSASWPPSKDTKTLNESSMQSMGNMLVINHLNPSTMIANGIYAKSIYMHLQHPSNLKPLDIVKTGDVIGYIGNTGRSTGAHLHFSLAVGDSSNLQPGRTGWIPLRQLPLINPCCYLGQYHL